MLILALLCHSFAPPVDKHSATARVPHDTSHRPLMGLPSADGLLVIRGGSSGERVYDVVTAYRKSLREAPFATNCATSAALTVISDRIAQVVDKSHSGLARSGWALVWGAMCSALLTPWFAKLQEWFPHAASRWDQLVLKLLVNQALVSPGINSLFFCFVVLTRVAPTLRMTRLKLALLMRKLRSELPSTMLQSSVYWTCIQVRCSPVDALGPRAPHICTSLISWLAFTCGRRSTFDVCRNSTL